MPRDSLIRRIFPIRRGHYIRHYGFYMSTYIYGHLTGPTIYPGSGAVYPPWQKERGALNCLDTNELHFAVVQNITSDLVLVSCAEIEPDGRIHVRNRSGQERSVKEVREALRPLSQDEVCVGQYVCIRGERGVLACRIEKLIEPENNRHQDLYSVTVLTRTPDGQYCKGPEMKRRMVYDFPESFLVRPLNCFKAILAPGQKAMFTQADCIGFNSSAQLNYRDGSNDPSSLVNWNKFVEDLLQLSLALKIPYKAIMKILSRQILRGLLLPPEGMQFRRPLDLNLSTSLS
ncbi:hypothetical protein BIW11_12953 [Tropilaelaps mercedesae]|uniref:Uncharacterized protein n=1 Tax=Tropilaelaps mercedesae TaxID=418985 RepID=A0A1V9X468_9ACAR|nr:hypothetical protein BIW11_12953 [Tropilaelaps mercedesae]